MANRIQYRRDTAANWTAANPVLALGEPGWETDTKLRKVGDGTTVWSGLNYQAPDYPTIKANYAKYNAVRAMLRNQQKNFYDLNAVMASPPTVTLEAASATIVTGVVTKTPQQALIQGPTPVDNGFGYFYTSPIAGVSGQNYQPWAVEFTLDGSRCEFKYATNSTTKLRVMVNGQYTSLTSSTLAGGSGNVRYGLIDFAGVRAVRHIRIEFDGFMLFHSIRIDPTAGLTASRRRGLTGLVMGDSYVAGTGADSGMSPWAATLGNLLGWGRTLTSGAPGTGYLKTNTLPKFRDRIATDVTALAPDIVVVSGGYNDYSTDTLYTPTQLGTEAGLLFDAIAAGLPNALIVVVSPFWTTDTPGTNRLAIAAAIKTQAQNRSLIYADMLVPSPIITGTGRVGTNRSVTDGATTAASTTVTSATAAFTSADVGLVITGAGIPANTVISSVTNTTTAVLSVAATATAAAVTLTITNQRFNGNADLYVSSDNVHPTQAGHDYIALNVASAICAQLPSLAP